MSRLAWRIVMWITILSMQVYILSTHILILIRADRSEITWRNYTICGVGVIIVVASSFIIAKHTRQYWSARHERPA